MGVQHVDPERTRVIQKSTDNPGRRPGLDADGYDGYAPRLGQCLERRLACSRPTYTAEEGLVTDPQLLAGQVQQNTLGSVYTAAVNEMKNPHRVTT